MFLLTARYIAIIYLLLFCYIDLVASKSYKANSGRSGSGISVGNSQTNAVGTNSGSIGSASANAAGPGGGGTNSRVSINSGTASGVGGGTSSRLSGNGPGIRNSAEHQLNIGLLVPHTNFGRREYLRSINSAVQGLQKGRGSKLTFLKDHEFQTSNIHFDMMSLTPSPTAILNTLCKEFLHANVTAILYMMNYESYGRSTASAQYFLQLAGYLGIPVISWNADNSGLERRASQSALQLQLAPSIEHQSAAMLSILERYKWHQFSVVTSQIAGHDDFVQAVREQVAAMDHFKFTILNSIIVTRPSDLLELVNSEARVMLLYCTKSEAIEILHAAEELQITGENYVWVVTQSVIENTQTHPQFPVGMLGVHFDTSSGALVNEIATAIRVYAYGVEYYLNDVKILDDDWIRISFPVKIKVGVGGTVVKYFSNIYVTFRWKVNPTNLTSSLPLMVT
uniref:ANF_receptor domain-containing protein n=1 Tax=Anopheles funestus TaxID=62324 RepID=A0A4Y0BI77_ANOFN